jgi:hypothetical protein
VELELLLYVHKPNPHQHAFFFASVAQIIFLGTYIKKQIYGTIFYNDNDNGNDDNGDADDNDNNGDNYNDDNYHDDN